MEIVCFLLLDAAIIYLFVRSGRRRYHRSDVQYVRKVRGAHELERLACQLEELDEILTQIDLARFHRLKGVTVSLPDSIAGDHSHTMLISGHDNNTRALRELIISERDQLRELLDKKIQHLAAHGTTQLTPGEIFREVGEAAALSETSLAPVPEIIHHRYGVSKREADTGER